MRDVAPLLHFAAANRLIPASRAITRGDVLLVHYRELQPHLLVALSDSAFVHAHAGLGRVVRQGGLCLPATIARWRLDEKD